MALSTGAASVLPVTGRDLAIADSANYYTAITPTPGTGVITGTPTSLVATTPALVVFNGGLLNVYLLYLRLSITVAGASALTRNFVHQVSQGNRYASGGTALTINNTNIMSNVQSSVTATWGAVTATAAIGVTRTLANDWFRIALVDIVGDVYEFQYGAPSGVGIGSSPATVANFVRSAPAIVLQPQSSYLLNIFATTFATGMTMEVQMGFAEK